MSIDMTLDDVEAWTGGGIVPPGTYNARIDTATEGTSSGGHPQIELAMTVVGGDYDSGQIRDWVVITDQSLGRVRALLEAAGVPIPKGRFSLDPSQLEGRQVEIVVRQEPYQGEMKTRVKAYNPPANTSDVPAPAEPAAAPSGGAKGDDDIPF